MIIISELWISQSSPPQNTAFWSHVPKEKELYIIYIRYYISILGILGTQSLM